TAHMARRTWGGARRWPGVRVGSSQTHAESRLGGWVMRTTIARPAVATTLFVALFGLAGFTGGPGKKKAPGPLKPPHAGVKYGPHERNVLDLYLPGSGGPAPLVLYIHGGGFRGGDKRSLNAQEGKSYLDAGFAVAAINYRLTDTAPMPAA